jgi:hypothetical protein
MAAVAAAVKKHGSRNRDISCRLGLRTTTIGYYRRRQFLALLAAALINRTVVHARWPPTRCAATGMQGKVCRPAIQL